MAIPTTVSIKFSCGHSEKKDLSHVPAGKRKAKAFGMGKNFVCSNCFRKAGHEDLDRQNHETLVSAQGFDEEHSLPELTGSEKQVVWGTRNRYEVLTEILDSHETEQDQQSADHALDAAKTLTRAGWWLDNTTDKDLDVDDLVELITTGIDDGESGPHANENPY